LGKKYGWTLILVVHLSHTINALAADPVGVLATLIGEVTIVRNGDKIIGSPGKEIYKNDLIVTGGKSRAQVLLIDQTAVNISQKAELIIDDFLYDETENQLSIKVTKGTFRFISGKIAIKNPDRVNVVLPAAVIGVRGTEFLGSVSQSEESVVALLSGKIEVANDQYIQNIEVAGYGVTIDTKGSIGEPVQLSDETLTDLLNAVSTRKDILDTEESESGEDSNDGDTLDNEDEDNEREGSSDSNEEYQESEKNDKAGSDGQLDNNKGAERGDGSGDDSRSDETNLDGAEGKPDEGSSENLERDSAVSDLFSTPSSEDSPFPSDGLNDPLVIGREGDSLSGDFDDPILTTALPLESPVIEELVLPIDVIQNIIQEGALEDAISDSNSKVDFIIRPQEIADVPENQLDFQSFQVNSCCENAGPPTFSLPRGQQDNDLLFSIDPETGLLSFNAAVDFEALGDDKRVTALVLADTPSGSSDIEFFIFNITDLPAKPISEFSSVTDDGITAARQATLSRFADWNDITQFIPGVDIGATAFGQDGTYTYSTDFFHDDASVRSVHIDVNTFSLVYELQSRLVDVSARGDVVNLDTNERVNFNLQFNNEPVQQFIDAGFSVGNMKFGTNATALGAAIVPDADDSVSISSGSITEMALEVNMLKDASSNTAVTGTVHALSNASVSQSATGELGAPTITE